MSRRNISRLFIGALLASAAHVALMPTFAHAGYNADDVLMSPPTVQVETVTVMNTHIGERLQFAAREATSNDYADVLMSPPTDDGASVVVDVARSESPPATVDYDPLYSETNKQPQAVLPEAVSEDGASVEPKAPVDYVADSADFDQDNEIVTLKGRVEIKHDGRLLKADRVVYHLKDDVATAEGNVIITDINGDVHYAESVELSDNMRKGLLNQMYTLMADESRLWAKQGIKESEESYILKDAVYTACAPCKEDPTKRPPWRMHAKDVKWLRDEQRVVYKNAWLEVGGVPVFYTPYFSHPDGTVEQKSGLLTPSFGWNSELGGFYDQPYYWAINQSTDATIALMPTTDEGPLLKGEFRKRWERAYVETQASITNSGRTDSVGNQDVAQNDEVRGHLFVKGGWDINNNWRAATDIEVTSDEQYLRQYGFASDAVLESKIYAEYFDDRDYAIVEAQAFQDIRAGSAKSDQPNVLPYGEISMLGEPGALLGGRWQWDASMLSLVRDGNAQDVYRGSTEVSWNRQDIAPVGLVFDTNLAMRADQFITTDRTAATIDPTQATDSTETRFFPSAQMTASYPLKNNFKSFQLRVEPVATVFVSPNIDNSDDIPNEDSQDVQLDAGNLLEGNRFPGLDRVEDNSHVAYGLRTGLYNYTGGRVSTFFGQSYNFDKNSNSFPTNSGLETQSSDYVGAINASFDDNKHNVSYRFQLDTDTLASERHELYADTYYGPISLDGYYLYAKGAAGTAFSTSREQVRLGATVDFTDEWSLRGDGVYDISSSDGDKGLRRAIFTLGYEHQCYDFAVTADRYIANESSGAQDTTVMFRIGLKNLGSYETGSFSLNERPGLNE